MKIVSYIRWIGIIILGLAVVIFGVRESIWLSKDAIDLNEVDWSDLKEGDHVEMDVNYLFDPFETIKDDGKETARKYAMPKIEYIEDDDGESYWSVTDFIAVNANTSDEYTAYDALSDATIDWWVSDETSEFSSEPVHIEGIVRKMQSDDIGFFQEYLDDIDYDYDDTAYEFCIYKGQDKNGLIIGIGALCMFVGVAGLAFKIIKGRRG